MRVFLFAILLAIVSIANVQAGECPLDTLGEARHFAESDQATGEPDSDDDGTANEDEEEEEEEEPDCE